MICHQKLVRDARALEHDPQLPEKRALAQSFANATVREISKKIGEVFIRRYEWIAVEHPDRAMGTTHYAFGLYFGEYLAGVACFGTTAGTQTAASVCGQEYAHMVRVLNRGACDYWAHPHSASYLIPRACNLMAEKGFHIFVAYSDADAGEIGTVYQACNWTYCGTTRSWSSRFVWPKKPILNAPRGGHSLEARLAVLKDGEDRDERCISNLVRDRQFPNTVQAYKTLCLRREVRARMVREGFIFYKEPPKGRYVTFAGDKNLVMELRASLQWNVLPYPKREVAA